MKKKIELPLASPVYTVNHGQAFSSAIFYGNDSIRNWYLNNSMVLSVSDQNVNGYFTPNVDICQSGIGDNPYIEHRQLLFTFLDGCINRIIRNMIDKEYYVYFGAVDDYFMKGKDGYHTRHFMHDGMICGYNQDNMTYSVYAYDFHMRLRVFQMPQSCLERARKSTEKMGMCGFVTAMKPISVTVEFDPYIVKTKIIDHLDPKLTDNNLECNHTAFGIVTHRYMLKYIDLIYDTDPNLVFFDIKPFKMIYEHKQIMLERIQKVEQYFGVDDVISCKYSIIADKAKLLWSLALYYKNTLHKNKLKTMAELIEYIDYSEQELLTNLISLYP